MQGIHLGMEQQGEGSPGHIVFAQVSRIDLSIRQRWTDLYRVNIPEGITFTSCMKRIESTADTLWSTDLSRVMHPVFNSRPGKGDNLGGFAKRQQKGAGKKAAKGDTHKGKGKGTGGKATAKTTNIKPRQPAMIANKKVKAAMSHGEKTFCVFFNKKGCSKGTDCVYEHACNLLTSPNSVCGKNYRASKHVRGTVAA